MRPRRFETRPINDDLVLAELTRRMRGYGAGERAAREFSVESSHLREMKSGRRPPSRKVANALGFDLMWVKRPLNKEAQSSHE